MSPIHSQIAPRHEAACVTEQEHRRTTVLVWRRQSAEHVLLGPLVATVGELLEQFLDHGGDDVARGDGVDADVEWAPFGGQVAGELNNGGFAGVVGGADQALDNTRLAY